MSTGDFPFWNVCPRPRPHPHPHPHPPAVVGAAAQHRPDLYSFSPFFFIVPSLYEHIGRGGCRILQGGSNLLGLHAKGGGGPALAPMLKSLHRGSSRHLKWISRVL